MKQSARQLLNSGILTRKNLFMPQSRSVPDVREKRRNWKKHMSEKDINHLVFLDESGVNINMTRHYARAWKTGEAVDKTTTQHALQYNRSFFHTSEWRLCLYSLSGRNYCRAVCRIPENKVAADAFRSRHYRYG